MARAVPQSYDHHARIVPGYHRVGLLFLVAALALSVVQVVRQRLSLASIFGLLVVVVLAQLYYYVRAFAVRNQDRIIRLEMRLRLERLLPRDLAARVGEYSTRQLVALRFAGDAELPALARRVLDEKIDDPRQIKRSIRDWQADFQRV